MLGKVPSLNVSVAAAVVLYEIVRQRRAKQTGDILTTVINTGGFIGDVFSGILYLLSVWLGYNQPDVAGHVHDYGTKFLVTAGLLNLLAIVDAYEIAAGRKD